MYRHTQTGWAIIASVVVLGGVFFFLPSVPPGMLLLALLILLLFSTLTVTVDRDSVALYFGPGLIRKRIPLKDAAAFRKLRGTWMCGWGIHGWPGKGWLFNVSGFDLVEVKMKNGMLYYIGTDEPDKLCEALRKVWPGTA